MSAGAGAAAHGKSGVLAKGSVAPRPPSAFPHPSRRQEFEKLAAAAAFTRREQMIREVVQAVVVDLGPLN